MQDVDQLFKLASDLLRITSDPEISGHLTMARGFGELAELYPKNTLYRSQLQIALGRLSWSMHERGLLQLALPDYASEHDLHVPADHLLRCLDRTSAVTEAEARHVNECDSCTELLLIFARATPDTPPRVPLALTFQQAKVKSILSAARTPRRSAFEFQV